MQPRRARRMIFSHCGKMPTRHPCPAQGQSGTRPTPMTSREAKAEPPVHFRVHSSLRKSSNHLMRGLGKFDAQGHLIRDGDAVAFEGHDFFRVVGKNANVFEAKVD